MGRDAIFHRIPIGPLGDGELALGRAGHALFIDGADHNTGAIGFRQFQHLQKAFIAILIVGGIENAFAASHLQTRLHLLPLGGIEHQRQVDIGHQSTNQLVHVPFAISTDVIDIDIEHMGVFLYLASGHPHQSIPILLRQQVSYFLAAAGIEPLADDQE